MKRAAEELGHEVKLIQVTRNPLWIAKEIIFRDLDLAFQRCVSFYRALASTMIFEELGLPVINSHKVIFGCEDKLYTSAKLEASGIPIPRTAIAMSREAALKAAEELGYPLVVKPITSPARLTSSPAQGLNRP